MSTDATGTIKIKLEDYWKGVAQENEYLRAQLAEKEKLLREAKEMAEFYSRIETYTGDRLPLLKARDFLKKLEGV